MTSRTSALYFVRIHLSSTASVPGSETSVSPSERFMSTNRLAFHTLLAKLREAFTFSSEKRMSLPGAFPVARVKRSASAPYLSMTSSGSMPLPRDLLILRPCASRTRPWMSTVSKGTSPICSSPEKIIRATQKKMMS